MEYVNLYHLKSTDNKVDNVCHPTEPNKGKKKVIGVTVASGEDKIATRIVEMTSNPAYGTGTCSKEHVSSEYKIIIILYKSPTVFFCFQCQHLLIWWKNIMTMDCLNSMKRGYMSILMKRGYMTILMKMM